MNIQDGYLLVVEDTPDILSLMEATLKFKGFRVVTARNGIEALAAIENERPLIVITDIMMPKMDGFSLVHRLRINPETRSMPIVFLTATYVAEEDRTFAINIGATRFIEKPINIEKFMLTLAELLAQGEHITTEPINNLTFYNEYRKRLEKKFNHKTSQITRIENLLKKATEAEKQGFTDSLLVAVNERDEIKYLLDQINEQAE